MIEHLRGAADVEETPRGRRIHRLPAWGVEGQPSCVRLVLATEARVVESLSHSTTVTYRGAHRPRGVIDLVVDGEFVASRQLEGGDRIEIDLRTSSRECHAGPPRTTRFELAEGVKLVELWLPHNETVDLVDQPGLERHQPDADLARRRRPPRRGRTLRPRPW